MSFVCTLYCKKQNASHNILFHIKIASNMGLGSNFILTHLKDQSVNVTGKNYYFM